MGFFINSGRAARGKCYRMIYRFQMPSKTSLAMVDVRSSWVSGGGGSWLYEERTAEPCEGLKPWNARLPPYGG